MPGVSKGLSREEMVEAMMVARYMKQSTVNDTITNSLAFLSTSGE